MAARGADAPDGTPSTSITHAHSSATRVSSHASRAAFSISAM